MSLNNFLEYFRRTYNPWRYKAVSRANKIRELRKRIKELTGSRDNWKEKAKSYRDELEELKKNFS